MIRVTHDTLRPGLNDFEDWVPDAIDLVCEYWANRAVTEMRTGARWTDRTTAARNGLSARSFQEADGATLVLWHSVPYGIWLEIRWSGRYAIIGPTLNVVAPQVLLMAGNAVMRNITI